MLGNRPRNQPGPSPLRAALGPQQPPGVGGSWRNGVHGSLCCWIGAVATEHSTGSRALSSTGSLLLGEPLDGVGRKDSQAGRSCLSFQGGEQGEHSLKTAWEHSLSTASAEEHEVSLFLVPVMARGSGSSSSLGCSVSSSCWNRSQGPVHRI